MLSVSDYSDHVNLNSIDIHMKARNLWLSIYHYHDNEYYIDDNFKEVLMKTVAITMSVLTVMPILILMPILVLIVLIMARQ